MTKPQLRHAAEPPFQQLASTSSLLGADVQITQNYFAAGSPGQTTSIQIHLLQYANL